MDNDTTLIVVHTDVILFHSDSKGSTLVLLLQEMNYKRTIKTSTSVTAIICTLCRHNAAQIARNFSFFIPYKGHSFILRITLSNISNNEY